MSLDTIFREREVLNTGIVEAINKASDAWGLACLRYEIRDIKLPTRVQDAMQLQVEAERKKRAQILESEGIRESHINVAEGEKRARILSSEAEMQEKINFAKGDSDALILKAKARAESLDRIGKSLSKSTGKDAGSLVVAEQYVSAFQQLAKKTNTLLLPKDVGNVSGMVSQAMTIYNELSNSRQSRNNDADLEEDLSDDDEESKSTRSSDKQQATISSPKSNMSG
jgi:regulator of protease activity HflC (stomatin/prohibitin superfamily)